MRASALILLRLLPCLALASLLAARVALGTDEIVTDVRVAPNAFNPSRGDQIHVTYELAEPNTVTICIYDPDGGLVRNLVTAAPRDAGTHEDAWDGCDDAGQPVPDEAYLFTIETASGLVYDPMTFSGGGVGDITDARFDGDTGTVVYKLPASARVLIRLGVHNGPMLKTLVDWKPRVVGAITEYWDGRDEDKLIPLRERKDVTALITYVTLPDATVVAFGNNREAYRDYKFGRAKDRPQRPAPDAKLRPVNLVPPAWARAPRVLMSFPKLSDGVDVPQARDTVDVHVDVDPTDRDYLLREQFEVIFFVDNAFFTEAERGYLPFNWRWELQQIPPGEHVLTVNISSFKGQVGVASRKVKVVKAAR